MLTKDQKTQVAQGLCSMTLEQLIAKLQRFNGTEEMQRFAVECERLTTRPADGHVNRKVMKLLQ